MLKATYVHTCMYIRATGDLYGDKGGQMFLVRVRFSAGNAVEVSRKKDRTVWDNAVIVCAGSHVDSARYTMRHANGDVTCTNMQEHLVQARSVNDAKKKKKKKKKKKSSGSSSSKVKRSNMTTTMTELGAP